MSFLDVRGLKVYIDDKTHDIYLKLRSQSIDKAEYAPFSTMKDLFIFSACLGFKFNYFKKLKNRRDIFSGELFDVKQDLPILAGLAFAKSNSVEILSEPKEIIEIAERWANGGIDIVSQRLLSETGFPLLNLVDMILEENKN